MNEIFNFGEELNFEYKSDTAVNFKEVAPINYSSPATVSDRELSVSKNELEIMPSYELESFAKKKAKYILTRIQNASEKVESAKKSAEKAAATSGFFSTKKKTDQNTETTILITSAMKELNEIVQESIAFTCLTIEFAKCMVGQISTLMVSGFQDSTGHIVRLNSTSKEQAQIILSQAEHFSNQQLEIKHRQNVTEQQLSSLSSQLDNSSQKMKNYDSLFEEYADQIEKLKMIVDQQDFRITQLENKIKLMQGN